MSACPRCGAIDASGRLSVCPRCMLAGLEGDDAALPELGREGLTLEGLLGEGGMGRVYRARDERLGRAVAVKVLRGEAARDPAFRARFSREARTLARLEHPGIVAVHDVGTTPAGESFLVMQLVEGGSLAGRPPLPPAEALAVTRALCDALAYAHGRGVVHRDIKPENVLCDEGGRVKLSDFGIARLLDPAPEDGPLTRPSIVMGTPGYMAPEARAGAAADPRMDVYAVGALLQHLLTGRDPDGVAAAGSGPAEVPRALAPVIARAMAVDPARRTPSAESLGRELAALASRFHSAASVADELPPEERTWRGAVALLAAVATAIGLYAMVVSFTPRATPAGEMLPFTAFGDQRLPDGRVLTRARFEVAPTLGAAVAIALAFLAYGLLRRHWRLAGLDRPAPDRPLTGSPRVLRLGLLLFALFLGREALERAGLTALASYVPVLGGCLELVMLAFFWDALFEAQLTSRAPAREPRLWLGLALSLFPPAYHLIQLARVAPALTP